MNRARIGDVLALQRRQVIVDPTSEYEEIGIRSFGKGIFHKEPTDGAALGAKRVFRIEPGDLVISNVFAWEGAIAVASEDEQGKIGSHRFMTFVPINDRIDTAWAAWFFQSELGLELIRQASPGSAGRNKTLAVGRFEDLVIPLPPLAAQRLVADRIERASLTASTLDVRSKRTLELARATQVSLTTPTREQRASGEWTAMPLADVVHQTGVSVAVDPSAEYRLAGVFSFGRGLIDRGVISGSETAYGTLTPLSEGNIVMSKLNGWEGAVGVVDHSFDGAHVSGEFPTFIVDHTQMLSGFFRGVARSPAFWEQLNRTVRGSMVRRRRISAKDFLNATVWLPSLERQTRVSEAIDELDRITQRAQGSAVRGAALLPSLLNREFVALA